MGLAGCAGLVGHVRGLVIEAADEPDGRLEEEMVSQVGVFAGSRDAAPDCFCVPLGSGDRCLRLWIFSPPHDGLGRQLAAALTTSPGSRAFLR